MPACKTFCMNHWTYQLYIDWSHPHGSYASNSLMLGLKISIFFSPSRWSHTNEFSQWVPSSKTSDRPITGFTVLRAIIDQSYTTRHAVEKKSWGVQKPRKLGFSTKPRDSGLRSSWNGATCDLADGGNRRLGGVLISSSSCCLKELLDLATTFASRCRPPSNASEHIDPLWGQVRPAQAPRLDYRYIFTRGSSCNCQPERHFGWLQRSRGWEPLSNRQRTSTYTVAGQYLLGFSPRISRSHKWNSYKSLLTSIHELSS